jgi:hypothetical protein
VTAMMLMTRYGGWKREMRPERLVEVMDKSRVSRRILQDCSNESRGNG